MEHTFPPDGIAHGSTETCQFSDQGTRDTGIVHSGRFSYYPPGAVQPDLASQDHGAPVPQNAAVSELCHTGSKDKGLLSCTPRHGIGLLRTVRDGSPCEGPSLHGGPFQGDGSKCQPCRAGSHGNALHRADHCPSDHQHQPSRRKPCELLSDCHGEIAHCLSSGRRLRQAHRGACQGQGRGELYRQAGREARSDPEGSPYQGLRRQRRRMGSRPACHRLPRLQRPG